MLLTLVQAVRRRPNSVTALFRHLGALGLFFLAILDSSPLPTFGGPDILIVILVASRRNPWYEYAAVATVGSVIGAYITFKLARKAGRAYLDSKFGKRSGGLLRLFDRWGTGALAASAAIPFPFPTSVFFAAAGASNTYRRSKYLTVVTIARVIRYSVIGILTDIYGRHLIRVLRHPMEYRGWLLLFAGIFVVVILLAVFIERRLKAEPQTGWKPGEPVATS